jgi:hypothetical protein
MKIDIDMGMGMGMDMDMDMDTDMDMDMDMDMDKKPQCSYLRLSSLLVRVWVPSVSSPGYKKKKTWTNYSEIL